MSQLQAAIEFQVELGKFYNVDLFQRGYYQIRTSLKMSPKVLSKVEIVLTRTTGSSPELILPSSVAGGVAISKTFQILYRREEIDINDIILFKVHMLVDVNRIEEYLIDADFQLVVELWFTEEDISNGQFQDKMTSITDRTLKLHLTARKGVHHHVPLLFDYFHLSAIFLTVHAALLALHQPYISLSRNQPISSGVAVGAEKGEASASSSSSMQSVTSGPQPTNNSNRSSVVNSKDHHSLSSRQVKLACARHRLMCSILLSTYESIQTTFESLLARLPSNKTIKLESVDCRSRLEELCTKCQSFSTAEEEDLLQLIQTDLSTLCGQNVILWLQFLEVVTLNHSITSQLAKEHHTQRVKRFSEGFIINEFQKQEVVACFDQSLHGHSEIASQVRSSEYYRLIPVLPVECSEIDGDFATIPIIFEDLYSEPAVGRLFRNSSVRACKDSPELRKKSSGPKRNSARPASVLNEDSLAAVKLRRQSKLKFIKTIRPESLKRPTSYLNTDIGGQVAMDQTDCTLVGYRKVGASMVHDVELGTLTVSTPSPLETNDHVTASLAKSFGTSVTASSSAIEPHGDKNQQCLYNAVSMPTLIEQNHALSINSSSLPELTSDLALLDDLVYWRSAANASKKSTKRWHERREQHFFVARVKKRKFRQRPDEQSIQYAFHFGVLGSGDRIWNRIVRAARCK